MMEQSFSFRRLLWGLCLTMLLVVVWVHGRDLASVPRGLYQDEAAIGLNALTIAENGHDEYGNLLPVFFKSFGDYKAPVYIYAAAGLQAIAGPSVTALRLTSVVFFLLLLAGAVRLAMLLYGRRPSIVLGTLLIVGFLPWLFPLSRIAFEVISQATLLMWILVLVLETFEDDRKRTWPAVVLGLLLGLCLYSYPTSRLLVPLTLLAILALFARKQTSIQVGWIIGAFAVSCIPLLYFVATTPEGMTARFSSITYVWNPDLSFFEKIGILFSNYVAYFSPRFLLFTGDGNARHATGLGGQLSMPVFVLMVIGLLDALRDRTRFRRLWILVVILLFIAPIAAALTQDGTPHALRSLPLAIVAICFAVRGVAVFINLPTNDARLFLTAFTFIALTNSGIQYVRDYFNRYPEVSEKAFESAGLLDAVAEAESIDPLRLIISDRFSGIHTAFAVGYLRPYFPVHSMKLEAIPGACIVAKNDETLPATSLPGEDIALPDTGIARLICYGQPATE